MFARTPFPPQWQGQGAGPRRFPNPVMETVGVAHNMSPAVNIQTMDSMANPNAMLAGHVGETMQAVAQGPPPHFIELRHNSQRLALRPQFMPRGPQPRPRLFPQQDMVAPYIQQHPLTQVGVMQTEAGNETHMGLQQAGLSVLMPQQHPGSVTQQPHLHPQVPSNPNVVTGQHQLQQADLVTTQQGTAPENSEELPEPDLEGLGEAPGDGGVEDEDDLALDLDPDKGDDDLGNLGNLETNDPHLDDLLNSDEFDLLAYTDPELDQGDPKDVFSDQLRLVEAESEPSSSSAQVKVEEKAKEEPKDKNLSNPASVSDGSTSLHLSPAGKAGAAKIKIEDNSLTPQLQPGQTVVKDEMEAVSILLGGNPPSTTSAKPTQAEASLSSVRLGGIPYSLSGQAEPLPFSPAVQDADIGNDPLGLPDVEAQGSLEGELPLLIQDLLEHEKKELQKQQQQQQLSSLQQGGMAPHFHSQNPQQNPQAPGQIMLPHHQRPPSQGMITQPGMLPRAPHMMQQQRLMGTGMAPPPHMAMAQQQVIMRMGQPGIPAGLGQQPHLQPLVKQSAMTNNFFPDKGTNIFDHYHYKYCLLTQY